MVKRVGGIAVAIIGILVVIVIKFGAGWGIGFLGAKASAPDVGECVKVSGPSSDVEVDDADCGDDGVLYKVVGKDDCDEAEDSVVTEVGGKDAVTICLWPDVADGTCIRAKGNEFATLVDCKKADANTFKVVTSADTAKGKCPKRSQKVVNETRDLSLCVGAPGR